MVRLSRRLEKALNNHRLDATVPWHLRDTTTVLKFSDSSTGSPLSVLKFWSLERGTSDSAQCATELEMARRPNLVNSGVVHTIEAVVSSLQCGPMVMSTPCFSSLDSELRDLYKRRAAAEAAGDEDELQQVQAEATELTRSLALSGAVALEVMEQQGIVHRDIKPTNIFVKTVPDSTQRGSLRLHPVVTDMGIACPTNYEGWAGDDGWPHPDYETRAPGYPPGFAPRAVDTPSGVASITDSLFDVWAFGRTLCVTAAGGQLPPEVERGQVDEAVQANHAAHVAEAYAASAAEVAGSMAAVVAAASEAAAAGTLSSSSLPSPAQLSSALRRVKECAAVAAESADDAVAAASNVCPHVAVLHAAARGATESARQHADAAAACQQRVLAATGELLRLRGQCFGAASSCNSLPQLHVPASIISPAECERVVAASNEFGRSADWAHKQRCSSYAVWPRFIERESAAAGGWDGNLIDLLLRMLAPREDRLSVAQVLQHPYLVQHLPAFRASLPGIVADARAASKAASGAMARALLALDASGLASFDELLEAEEAEDTDDEDDDDEEEAVEEAEDVIEYSSSEEEEQENGSISTAFISTPAGSNDSTSLDTPVHAPSRGSGTTASSTVSALMRLLLGSTIVEEWGAGTAAGSSSSGGNSGGSSEGGLSLAVSGALLTLSTGAGGGGGGGGFDSSSSSSSSMAEAGLGLLPASSEPDLVVRIEIAGGKAASSSKLPTLELVLTLQQPDDEERHQQDEPLPAEQQPAEEQEQDEQQQDEQHQDEEPLPGQQQAEQHQQQQQRRHWAARIGSLARHVLAAVVHVAPPRERAGSGAQRCGPARRRCRRSTHK